MKRIIMPALTVLLSLGVFFLRLNLGLLVAMADSLFITGFTIISVELLSRLFYEGAFDPFLYLLSRTFREGQEHNSYYDFRNRERTNKCPTRAHVYIGVSLLTLGALLSVLSLF